MGSHAGPVGSITTSRTVPSAAPARAAASTSPRLLAVGHALRLAIVAPLPSSTRTVWALAMPKSMPTRRLSAILSSSRSAVVSHRPPRREAPHLRPRSQDG